MRTPSPSCVSLSALMLIGVLAAGCDRRGGLSGRYAELVVVLSSPPTELLTREARATVPTAVMGETSSGAFLVRNIGDAPLSLTRLALSGGDTTFAAELPERTVLEPFEETNITVTFSPAQASDVTIPFVTHTATFRLESSGGRVGEGVATIEVEGLAQARDCFVPEVLDFGDAPLSQAVVMPLELSNATEVATTATFSAIAGADPAFFFIDGSSPVDLAPRQPRRAEVRFSPTAERAYSASIKVRRRSSCPEATTRLIGTGSEASLSWSPSMLTFGKVPLSETVSRSVTLQNRSGVELAVQVTADGADFSTPTASVSVPARGSVTIVASCTPTTLRALSGTLRLDIGTSPTLPARVPLSCSGGGPRLRASPNPLGFGNVPLLYVDTMPAPVAQQPVVARRLRVENVGTPPPTASDASFNLTFGRDGQVPYASLAPLPGTLASEFRLAVGARYDPSLGVPAIAGRNTLDFDVQIQPASPGFKEAVLTLYSNDAVQPAQQVRLTANAVRAEACTLGFSPVALLFGDVPPNSTEAQTVTVTNSGRATCLLAGLEVGPGSNPAFSLANLSPTLSLQPGASTPLQVRVDTTGLATGTALSGSLRFTAAGMALPRVIPLSGRVAQCLAVVPEEIDFGNIKLGCQSSSRPAQLFNTCGTPITITGLSTTNPAFGISTSPSVPMQLNGGAGAVPVGLVFRPPTLGVHRGSLVVSVREGASTRAFNVALVGTGDTTGTTVETYAQAARPTADILFNIDDSCSMADEQRALANNFTSFIQYATTANVDYRIAVTTTDDFAAARQGRFVRAAGEPLVLEANTPSVAQVFARRVSVGIGGSGFERPFSTALKALTPPLIGGDNAGLLRDDANLAVILVTDAPEQSAEPIGYYLSRLPMVKGPRRIHQVSVSVIGPFSAPSASCNTEGLDSGRYDALVRATGGVKADICTMNWARDLEALGRSALGPRNTFFVRNPPDTNQPIDVQVNGQAVSNAWTYDAANNAIVFTPTQQPGSGTTLTITYQSVCL